MKKPVEAIERMRGFYGSGHLWDDSVKIVLSYLDSIPEWPADLTRERLMDMATKLQSYAERHGHDVGLLNCASALRRLAAVAPKREKRKVTIWCRSDLDEYIAKPSDWAPYEHAIWRKVGEVEIDA